MYHTFCIGVPGQPPRMFITCDAATAKMQCGDGEVCFFEANYKPAPHIINAEGTSVVAVMHDLATTKRLRWKEAKTHRDSIMWGGFTTLYGRVDTHPDGYTKLMGAGSAAAMFKATDRPYEVEWTLADNSTVLCDIDRIIEMATSAHLFHDSVHAAGRTIRRAIETASDHASVNAVDITSGYPLDYTR